jgi:3-mercaptopyruvate sulfurtransferase SseA
VAQPLLVCKFRPQPEEAFRPVADAFRVHVVDGPVRPWVLDGGDPDAIWSVGEVIDRELLDAAPRLRVVVNHGVGYDTIDAEELERRRDELVVVDARVPARYRGEPNPVDRVRGRIPGALNAPWNEPLPDLPEGDLVAYCGSGVTACVVLHRLALSGREGRLYPGSWSEWEQRDLPVERG